VVTGSRSLPCHLMYWLVHAAEHFPFFLPSHDVCVSDNTDICPSCDGLPYYSLATPQSLLSAVPLIEELTKRSFRLLECCHLFVLCCFTRLTLNCFFSLISCFTVNTCSVSSNVYRNHGNRERYKASNRV
jgi:hypothetical protein